MSSFLDKQTVLTTLQSRGVLSAGVAALLSDSDCVVFPGFADVHVHLREPGFSVKETIATGTAAAAAGGYTCLCSMANLNPVPDTKENLFVQLGLIRIQAHIPVLPYGAITMGEKGLMLADMEEMAPFVAGFSDDGRGVQDGKLMAVAMEKARSLGKVIVAHCEDEALVRRGYIHDGAYAAAHGHKGICSESEWKPIERDLMLAKETGCAYHICHVSCKESVALIREAKKQGVDVTCETAPHYLTLTEQDLQEDGRFKMNPPLREEADRQALIAGIADGTVDMIATDHAPHTVEDKSKGLAGSAMGVVGLETAFPVLYTALIRPGILSMDTVIRCLTENPRKRFSLPEAAGYTFFDLNAEYTVEPETFRTKGRSTPFAGRKVQGKCLLTVVDNKIVWQGLNE